MKALLRKITQILREKRTRRLFSRTAGGFAAVIAFIATYSLIQLAMKIKKADCGNGEH